MNLIDIEDRLKDLSDQQLMQQMQRPDGTAPQFLVMSELKRRKEMRSNAPAPDSSTVKDDLVQQGIGSVASQQQPMPQGDGIPRYNNGMFPGTNIAVRPTAQDYARYLRTAGGAISQAMSGPNTLPKIFDRSSKGMTVADVRRSLASDPMFGGDESAGAPPPTSQQIFNPTGANSYAVKPRNLIQRQRAVGTDPDSMVGDVTPPALGSVPGYGGSDIGLAPRSVFASGPQMTAGGDYVPIDPARSGDFPDFGVGEDGTSSAVNNSNNPANPTGAAPANPTGAAPAGYPASALAALSGGGASPVTAGGQKSGTDWMAAIEKITNAPASSSAPAVPASNYYEGIEKKLAAMQAAETGPDVGMALLRAGLGMAQAGGEGKSTASALGAGGIAGLDAYEASKKAKDARAMQLLGVESDLAGAKTTQAYNQQKLALDARQRDIAEQSMKLNALGLMSNNETKRYLGNQTAAIQQQRNMLEGMKIDIDARNATEKLRLMEEEGGYKKTYYTALANKADRGDHIDRYINADDETRKLLLPLLRKNNVSLQDDIGKAAGKLMLDMGWVNDTKDRLTKQLNRNPTMNEIIAVARNNAMGLFGQGGRTGQAPQDPSSIRR